jgi:hypothetical protein
MVPAGQLCRVFGAMSPEYTKVVQPRRREDDVIVVVEVTGNLVRQRKQSRLMAVFLDRIGLATDQVHKCGTKIVRHDGFVFSLIEERPCDKLREHSVVKFPAKRRLYEKITVVKICSVAFSAVARIVLQAVSACILLEPSVLRMQGLKFS